MVEAWPAVAARRLRNADFVVLANGPWACTARRAAKLREVMPGRFAVIGPKSFGWNNNAVMLIPPARRYQYRATPLAESVAGNAAAKPLFRPGEFIDVLGMLSSSDGTVAVFTPDRKFIS